MDAPLEHQVEKKASSLSAMLRRIMSPRVHLPLRALLYSPAWIGQFETSPVVQARSFGSFAGRQAPPGVLGKGLRNLRRGAPNKLLLAPRVEYMVGGNTQNVTLAQSPASIGVRRQA